MKSTILNLDDHLLPVMAHSHPKRVIARRSAAAGDEIKAEFGLD
ncbi:hypothetical protein [Actinoplanes sp. NPDC026670]